MTSDHLTSETSEGHIPEVSWLAGVILAVCCLVELVLQLSDTGLIGLSRARPTAYEYAGFWPGLVRDWAPNYAAQPYLMFVSYGFLHGGLWHLAINMLTLISITPAIVARVGNRGFALLFLGALLGGAMGYALLADGLLPMVGASGALFGLIGGQLAWIYVDKYTHQDSVWGVVRAVILLILLNFVLWWAMDGQLAWETHLGGFIAGWICALLIDPTSREQGVI